MHQEIQDLKKKGDFAAISRLMPYVDVIGLDCDIQDGSIVARLKHKDTNIGNFQMGFLHGGTVAALLEHAAILHVFHKLDIATMPKIINISVDYLRPCTSQDTFASATLVKQGKRIANLRIQAWQANPAKPVATAHAHFLLT